MKILNLSNHKLTEKQIEELKERLKFREIVELDKEDKKIWNQLTIENYKKETKRIMEKYNVDSYHIS